MSKTTDSQLPPTPATPLSNAQTLKFADLHLNEMLLESLAALGFESPTQIQEKTLPLLLGDPTDFLGLAATGTGKTGAFTIPLLQRLDPKRRDVQALVLCPTRELAMQVSEQMNLMGKGQNLRALPVYGGAPFGDQLRGLQRGVHIVVGTPGRIIDHIERGSLRLEGVNTLILDEADEMISMGFKDDIETILKQTPRDQSNTWLFSATMSPEVRRVADTYLRSPKLVRSNDTQVLSTGIEQIYYVTQESNKPEVLCKLIDAADGFFGLIFCQTKSLVIDLTRYLNDRGYGADCLHGDMDQRAREQAMARFREHKVKILVCTDVAARGIDVKDITHVVNFSIPRELDNYVHRIGRTARSGKSGLALSLTTPAQRGLVRRIEAVTKSKMKEGKIPTRKEIALKKVAQILARFNDQNSFPRALELLDGPWKQALANMDVNEIAARFLTLSFPEVFNEDREQTEATRALKPQSNAAARIFPASSPGRAATSATGAPGAGQVIIRDANMRDIGMRDARPTRSIPGKYKVRAPFGRRDERERPMRSDSRPQPRRFGSGAGASRQKSGFAPSRGPTPRPSRRD